MVRYCQEIAMVALYYAYVEGVLSARCLVDNLDLF
jgi:hypothetical protein